jgi:hypothetical protein
MPAAPCIFEGRCHCGAVGYTFHASQPPARWLVRACQCSFCRAHGARTISDPNGSVTFKIADASKLNRYRFGTRTTDFLICNGCGAYLAAVLTSARGQVATLNVNAMQPLADLPEAAPVSYDGESGEQRTIRREQRWTPVAGTV